MRKQISLWLIAFLAFSLAFPLWSMSQTKLTLEDSTGNRISTPGIKSYGMGTDNNLVIVLDQPFNFTDLLPDIYLESPQSCTITGAAGVSATPGTNLSFNVRSSNTAATFSLVAASNEVALPPLPRTLTSANGIASFSWNTGSTPPGSYLAVFEATVTGASPPKSQLVVMITLTRQYTVSSQVTNPAGGSVSPASQSVSPNGTATFTINYNSGYTGATVSAGSVSGTTWTIPNVTASISPTITFTAAAPPPPAGEALIWNNRYTFFLGAGTQKVYIATVPANMTGFSIEIMGTTLNTDATFTWTFPDGRVFPPPGEPHIYSVSSSGKMSLVGAVGGWHANISDQYIPPGNHVLTIKATSDSTLVMTPYN